MDDLGFRLARTMVPYAEERAQREWSNMNRGFLSLGSRLTQSSTPSD